MDQRLLHRTIFSVWQRNYYEQVHCGDNYNLGGETIVGDVDQNHFVDEHIYFNHIEDNIWIITMPSIKVNRYQGNN